MQDKMVDFAISLLPVDGNIQKRIRHTLSIEGLETESLNQTHHQQIRDYPIAINMETKIPFSGGEKSDIQLATWIGAGFRRLQRLLDSNPQPTADIPVMPALSMHGHDMYLSFFKMGVDENVGPILKVFLLVCHC